ncbi:MAG: SAM-dependent methyltransferase [Candidatus Margulisbacteria bacterium]|nr:SAM-dependent methyltransferase [Candidatus Margulisiibacteriota bacterium]
MTNNEKDMVCLDSNRPFSKSAFWKIQGDYYLNLGISAWAQVPFYATSNLVIAKGYAFTIFKFLQEGLKNGIIDREEPVYLVELGAGQGKLTYHILNYLVPMLKEFNMEDVKYRHVMTDFATKNIEFWGSHHQIMSYVKKGYVDFAHYDATLNKGIHLIHQKITLNKGKCKNPIMVIANYFFDAIPHDVFEIESGKIKEGLVDLFTPQDNLDGQQVKDLNSVDVHFHFRDTKLPYYEDKTLNDVLSYYLERFDHSSILIPVGGIHCLNHLSSFSDGRLLLISGDKGYGSESAINNLPAPRVACQGSFSIMVNFPALSKYIELKDGFACQPDSQQGLKIFLMGMGLPAEKLKETLFTYKHCLSEFNSQEFLAIKNVIIKYADDVSLQDILATIRLSEWDPKIVMAFSNQLIEKIPNAGISFKEELSQNMGRIRQNHFHIPNQSSHIFEIGRLYYALGEFEEAIDCYKESLDSYSEDWGAHFNVGLSYYYLEKDDEALTHFKKALELSPDSDMVQEWIDKLKSDS